MQKLRTLDEVAYIRFASVYRNFADLEEMRDAMEGLPSLHPEDDSKPARKSSNKANGG
jgi:transcriptional repressor NrdR